MDILLSRVRCIKASFLDFKAFVTALQRNGNSSGSPSVPGGGSGGKPGNDDDEMSVD